MKGWAALVVSVVTLTAEPVARADYLEIRRSAHFKRAADPNGPVVEKLPPGTLLELAAERQQNGYYRARTRGGAQRFVYRTLVRRHRGSIPADDGTPASTREPSPDEPLEEGETRDEVQPAAARLSGPQMRAHLIDVGQGAATLFEFSCGVVLIDTGGETNGAFASANALSSYLDEFFDERQDLERSIALLVITHPHVDHARNVKLVAEEYRPQHVVTSGLTKTPTGTFFSGGRQQAWLEQWARQNARLETIRTASVPKGGLTSATIDPLRCTDQDPEIRVLWGRLDGAPDDWSAKAFANANNHSVVVRVDFGQSSFLVSGDLEEDAIPSLIAKHQGTKALDIDVWEVSHHGSHNGTSEDLLDALTPAVALLATGSPAREGTFTAWAFGHPRESVIEQLLQALPRDDPFRRARRTRVPTGAAVQEFKRLKVDEAVYATVWDGSVVVAADVNGAYAIQTER